MFDKNVATLVGRLGHAPDIRKTTDTGCFVVISIATNERYKVKGETIEDTQWHKVHFNNWLGKKAASLKKGDRIYVSGRFRANPWEDKAGNKHYSVVIEAIEFELLAKQPEPENKLLSDTENVDEENSNLKVVLPMVNKYLPKTINASNENVVAK